MREGLTKKESAFIKGLALWMMIYHHRFINPIIWNLDPEFQGNFIFLLGEEFTRVVSWFCKIALSLMAFVSGYGICYVFRKSKKDKVLSLLRDDYRSVIKRLIPFYGRYWYAFIVWTFAEIAINHTHFQNPEYLLNGLGLSYSLNGSWWYILQYVEMMLLAPIMDLYFTSHGKKVNVIKWVIPVIVGGIVLLVPALRLGALYVLEISRFQISYMAIFVVGYIVARWNLFGIIRTWLSKLNPFIHYGLCMIGLVGIMALRIKLSTFAAYCRTDFFIAPIWILCACELLYGISSVSKYFMNFFGWFSKYPMYIWVLHLIFMDKFFHPITLITHLACGNYLTVVLLVTIASVVLDRIEYAARFAISKIRNRSVTQ